MRGRWDFILSRGACCPEERRGSLCEQFFHLGFKAGTAIGIDDHGKKLTREDHPAVSNQLYNFYAVGKDTLAMKAVVGEDALTTDDKNYLLFLEKFENQFLQQGKYEKRDIFRSLEGAWDLLRRFEKKALTKIGDQDVLRKYYDRKGAIQR